MKLFAPKLPPVLHLETEKQAQQALLELQKDTIIGLDTETDALYTELVTVQYSNGKNRVVVPVEFFEMFRPAWQDAKLKKVCHNAAYELEIFEMNKCPLKGVYADTMVMHWLCDENAFQHGLEVLAQEFFGVQLPSLEDLFGIQDGRKQKKKLPSIKAVYENPKTRDEFLDYGSKDPFYTIHAYFRLKDQLKEEHIWEYYKEVEGPFTETLWRMGRRGVALNLPLLQEIGNAVWNDRCRAKHLFVRAVGHDVNLNSPKQLVDLFIHELKWPPLKFTEGSLKKAKEADDESLLVPCVDSEVLEAYAEDDRKIAQLLVEHRRAAKAVSSFIMPFFSRCDAEGVIRSYFKQIGTVTGRLSSSEPNLQNVPAREEKDPHKIRRVFNARKGKSLIVADYGGIELRVMAHESGDERMVASFQPGSPTEDLHALTASQLFPELKKLSLKEIKEKFSDLRAKAKSINFLIQYGGQGGKAAKVIGCPEKEGQAFIDKWLGYYTGVAAFMESCKAKIRQNGYVLTLGGRRRRIKISKSMSWGAQAHAERQAMNSPIQGGAADILKKAMVTLDRDSEFTKLGWYMVLQIHDELVCEGPTESAEKALPIIVKHMEDSYRGVLRVPLKAVAKIGQNWHEAK